MPLENLDTDQQKVLFVYSLYSDEKELKFFQYTAALATCYYLMKKGVFPNYKDQLLVYDYKNSRRYLWEDKKFMNDINILRQNDTLIRARARNRQYRDINSHQCSKIGHEFLTKSNFKKTEYGGGQDAVQCHPQRSVTQPVDQILPGFFRPGT